MQLMQSYCTDERIRYVRNEQTLPMHENWSKGVAMATGTYIKMLCSDDVLTPLVLERMVSAMEQNPGVAVVSTGRQYIGEKDRVFKLNCHGKLPGKDTVLNTLRTYNWLASPSTVMLRRKNFDITGGFGPYRWITDWEMWVRHLLLGDYFAIPEVLVYERVHNGSVTRSFNMNMIKFSEEYLLFRKIAAGDYGNCFLAHQEELDQLLRRKVLQCSAYMFSRIPKLHKGKDRQAFMRMLHIVQEEGMLTAALKHWMRRKLPRTKGMPGIPQLKTRNI